MEEKRIKLHSRDGINNWLEYYGDSTYILHSELDHIRCGYADDSMKEIQFVDPPGGPFMSVGSELMEADNAVIKSIRHIKGKGFAITFA